MVNLAVLRHLPHYEVYKETGRTSVWELVTADPFVPARTWTVRQCCAVTMYGRIPPSQLSALAGNVHRHLVSTINSSKTAEFPKPQKKPAYSHRL